MGILITVTKGDKITCNSKCSCGFSDYFVGDNGLYCEGCGKKIYIEEKVVGILKEGPLCSCGFSDYLLGTDRAKCIKCEKTVDRSELE